MGNAATVKDQGVERLRLCRYARGVSPRSRGAMRPGKSRAQGNDGCCCTRTTSHANDKVRQDRHIQLVLYWASSSAWFARLFSKKRRAGEITMPRTEKN